MKPGGRGAATVDHVETILVAGADLEVFRGGVGPTLLLLHGSYGWWGWEQVHDRLAERFDVFAPSHPGFGRSARPPKVDTIDDLAYYYLDLIADRFAPAAVVGFGLGGWIACEMAVRCPHAIPRLVLVDSVGIKISDRESRDIADPFILPADAIQAMMWHDPSARSVPIPSPQLPEATNERMLRNQEAAMVYGWKPFMHNPKLRQRLHRVTCPSLVVWGEEDRIVNAAYGRAIAEAIPGARFLALPDAGHYPHREQTEAFVQAVANFISS